MDTGAINQNVDYLLSSLINNVIKVIRMRITDSQIRFVVNLDSKLPNALVGDETRIRQVLINLLENAVKYTDRGYVSFAVYGEMIDDDTVNLIMEIKDSGRGIKQEDIGKLFHNYFKIGTEPNEDIDGVGLGLAAALNIFKVMNGDMTIQSEYGKGSLLTITLPQKIQKFQKLAIVENPDEKNVLVYERREMCASSVVYALSNLGVRCELVSNDEGFCNIVKKNPFSHIFISHALFKTSSDTILKFCENSQIVLLAEFDESIPAGNRSILTMPAHAISVANVFY